MILYIFFLIISVLIVLMILGFVVAYIRYNRTVLMEVSRIADHMEFRGYQYNCFSGPATSIEIWGEKARGHNSLVFRIKSIHFTIYFYPHSYIKVEMYPNGISRRTKEKLQPKLDKIYDKLLVEYKKQIMIS